MTRPSTEYERMMAMRTPIEERLGRSVGDEPLGDVLAEVLGYRPRGNAELHDVLDEIAKTLGLQCSEGVGGFSSPPERCSLPEGHDGPHVA